MKFKPFFAFWIVRFRATSGLDSPVDPVLLKNVNFEHVKGIEEAKNELQDVVEFLKNPQKFTTLGGKLPKGETLLLVNLSRKIMGCQFIFIFFHLTFFRSSPGGTPRYWKDPAGQSCSWRG